MKTSDSTRSNENHYTVKLIVSNSCSKSQINAKVRARFFLHIFETNFLSVIRMSLLKTVRYAVSGHVRCGRTLIFCIFGRHEIHQENDDMKLKIKKNGGICFNESSRSERHAIALSYQ